MSPRKTLQAAVQDLVAAGRARPARNPAVRVAVLAPVARAAWAAGVTPWLHEIEEQLVGCGAPGLTEDEMLRLMSTVSIGHVRPGERIWIVRDYGSPDVPLQITGDVESMFRAAENDAWLVNLDRTDCGGFRAVVLEDGAFTWGREAR